MDAVRHKLILKRVYDTPEKSDGFRVLVDRLWPRGLKKEGAGIDAWVRDIAPSNDLRRWFHAHREDWTEFRQRYLKELRSPSTHAAVLEISDLAAKHRRVTLLFSSKDAEQNNATVLKEFLESKKK